MTKRKQLRGKSSKSSTIKGKPTSVTRTSPRISPPISKGARKIPATTFPDATTRLVPLSIALPSAAKRMLAYQIERALAQQSIPRSRLAQMLGTSRAAVNRLLDPENRSVTLQTIERVTQILGKQVHIFIKDQDGVV